MTHLVGAWSRSGAPIAQLLSRADRAAMRTQLPSAGYREMKAPGLWMVTERASFAQVGERAVGFEGERAGAPAAAYLSGGDTWLCQSPPGHACMVQADGRARRLRLTRSLSGGERLYYAELGDLVLFAGSLRFLLAYPGLRRELDMSRVPEVLLSGRIMFGEGTLIARVNEVLPGHTTTWHRGHRADHWHGPNLSAPLCGNAHELARAFHDELIDSVVAAAGSSRPVAVSLSGGIDSAAVAALAVEAFGARNVVAFTYEFDDPSHPCETPYASAVCRALGIVRHHVFKLDFQQFLAAIPETIWRAEELSNWPKAFMLQVARRVREQGFERLLSGFGVGSHMGYCADLAWCLDTAPRPATVLGHWPYAYRRRGRWLRHIERVHPGLAYPGWRLLLPFGWLLRERGLVGELESLYPPNVQALAARVPRAGAAERWLAEVPLADALRQLAFDRLVSCVDVTRWEKPLRELGVQRISPAHFAATLPFAYLPLEPQPTLWSAQRRLRPGKLLLRLAMRGVLPEAVLHRRKSWADAVISPRWFEAGVRWMGQALHGDGSLHDLGSATMAAAQQWDRRAPQAAVTAFGLWWRLFIERPPEATAPSWSRLAG